MAPKLKNNNKGQALIEATGMMVIAGAFLFILLRALLAVIFSVALDAMAEDFFICELEKKTDCLVILENRLKQNQMKDIAIQSRYSGQKIILTLSAKHLASMTVTREFDYEKFRQEF